MTAMATKRTSAPTKRNNRNAATRTVAPTNVIRIYRVECDEPMPTKSDVRGMATTLVDGDCRTPRFTFYAALADVRTLRAGTTADLANAAARRVAREAGRITAITLPATRDALGRPRRGEDAPRVDQSRANTLTACVAQAFEALYPHVLIVCEAK
jgi:hypothetical protein